MKKWLVVCAIVCGLTLPGCVLVFAPEGPLEPYGGPPPEEFEMRDQEMNEHFGMREREMNERTEHLEMWEQELREWQGRLEDGSEEHEEEDVDWEE